VSKHTPGPWEIEWGLCISIAGIAQVPQTADGTHTGNALLISAAPDLLEALKEITADYSDRFDIDDPSTNPGIKSSVKQARAAIVKATGEQA
jgi:hypothetical protein